MNIAQYEARLRQLPCAVGSALGLGCCCEELHHAGDATDRDDWNQIPICHAHHQGPLGIHPSRRAFENRNKGLTEMRLLAVTRKLYAKEYGA